MKTQQAIALIGVSLLVMHVLLLHRWVRRGRQLCRLFAEQLPEAYAEQGNPLPAYRDRARCSAYFRFIRTRRFAMLPDRHLADRFASHRRFEVRQAVLLVVGWAVFGFVVFWFIGRHAD